MTEADFRAIVGNERADALLRPRPIAQPEIEGPLLELPARWDLPMPPSINQVWATVKDHHTGKKKRVLTEQARDYRNTIKSMVHGRLPEGLFTLRLVFYYPWYFKNGKLNKLDETNRIKLLEDCIAYALDVDDSRFKRPDIDSVDTTTLDRMQAVRVYVMPLRECTEK